MPKVLCFGETEIFGPWSKEKAWLGKHVGSHFCLCLFLWFLLFSCQFDIGRNNKQPHSVANPPFLTLNGSFDGPVLLGRLITQTIHCPAWALGCFYEDWLHHQRTIFTLSVGCLIGRSVLMWTSFAYQIWMFILAFLRTRPQKNMNNYFLTKPQAKDLQTSSKNGWNRRVEGTNNKQVQSQAPTQILVEPLFSKPSNTKPN